MSARQWLREHAFVGAGVLSFGGTAVWLLVAKDEDPSWRQRWHRTEVAVFDLGLSYSLLRMVRHPSEARGHLASAVVIGGLLTAGHARELLASRSGRRYHLAAGTAAAVWTAIGVARLTGRP